VTDSVEMKAHGRVSKSCVQGLGKVAVAGVR
jgi:hypothetical protein